jgi:hypothetical protein
MDDPKVILKFEEICDAILGANSDHVKFDLLGMKKPMDKEKVMMKAFGKSLQRQKSTQVAQ